MIKILVCLIILGGMVVSNQASAAVFHDSLLTNGKFDDGLLAWTLHNMDSSALGDQYALDGPYVTLGQINQTVTLSQTITVPEETGQATLSFYYRLYTDDTTTNDYLSIRFANQATGAILLTDTISASAGDVSAWTKHTVDVSELSGDTVTMSITVVNNANLFTFVDLDTVRLVVDSYGELKAKIVDTEGDAVRNATITIRKPNNTKIWTGTTNSKGKFTATLLPGNSKKYRLVIKKDGETIAKRTKINWAERTTKTFTFSD